MQVHHPAPQIYSGASEDVTLHLFLPLNAFENARSNSQIANYTSKFPNLDKLIFKPEHV